MTFANRILDTKLLVGNWAKLGMDHILLMADSKETCDLVAPQIPGIGCTWDTFTAPLPSTTYMAWHIR